MYFPLLLTLAVVGSVLLTVLCALLFYRGVYLLWLNLQLLVSTPNHAVKLEFVCKCVCVCVMVMELRLGRRGVLWAECPGVKSLRWAVRCSGVWFWVVSVDDGGVDGSITLGQQPQGSAQAKPTSCPQGLWTEVLMCSNGLIHKHPKVFCIQLFNAIIPHF